MDQKEEGAERRPTMINVTALDESPPTSPNADNAASIKKPPIKPRNVMKKQSSMSVIKSEKGENRIEPVTKESNKIFQINFFNALGAKPVDEKNANANSFTSNGLDESGLGEGRKFNF